MRYAAVALDFDGTLAHDGEVPAHVVEGLRRLKATGRTLLLVTGRELPELLAIFPEIGLFERVVAENGALLYRPESGEAQDLGEPPPPALVALLRERGVPISVGDTIIATVEPFEGTVLRTIHDPRLEHPVIFNKAPAPRDPPRARRDGRGGAFSRRGRLDARDRGAAQRHVLLHPPRARTPVRDRLPDLRARRARRVPRLPAGRRLRHPGSRARSFRHPHGAGKARSAGGGMPRGRPCGQASRVLREVQPGAARLAREDRAAALAGDRRSRGAAAQG